MKHTYKWEESVCIKESERILTEGGKESETRNKV